MGEDLLNPPPFAQHIGEGWLNPLPFAQHMGEGWQNPPPLAQLMGEDRGGGRIFPGHRLCLPSKRSTIPPIGHSACARPRLKLCSRKRRKPSTPWAGYRRAPGGEKPRTPPAHR